MAKFADIIVPEIFLPYMIQRTAEKSRLISSGLLARTPELDRLAIGGGRTANMPFWNDLNQADVIWDEAAGTSEKLSTAQDASSIHYRKHIFEASTLAKYASGDDPAGAAATMVGDYWARQQQKLLIASLTGVFASTTMAAEHVSDVAIEDGDNAAAANLASRDTVVEALALLGDEINAMGLFICHSRVYWNLVKLDEIQFIQPSEIDTTLGGPDGSIPTFAGKIVIVDDGCPVVAGGTSGNKYTSYLAGAGAIGYGLGAMDPDEAIETDREPRAGQDILVTRMVYIMHPLGVAWGGTPAGVSPTNVELAVGGSWTRVYEKKNVRLAALVTNG